MAITDHAAGKRHNPMSCPHACHWQSPRLIGLEGAKLPKEPEFWRDTVAFLFFENLSAIFLLHNSFALIENEDKSPWE